MNGAGGSVVRRSACPVSSSRSACNYFVIHKGVINASWKANIRPKAKQAYNQTK